MARALRTQRDWPVSERARPLAVRRAVLTDFRSYARAVIETDARPVVLTGPNAAGKTNLLEALSFLSPGRGLRGARLAEVDRAGAGPFAVAARVEGANGPVELGTGRDQAERERRVVRVDGADAPNQSTLAEHMSVVWLTPAMDRLFQDGPGERRRFLDRLVMAGDPAHPRQAARYAHFQRERARLLRAGRFEPAWLGSLERRAAEAGVAIAAARRQAVAALVGALAEDQGRFPRPGLQVAGDVEDWLDAAPAVEGEERVAAALADSRARDAETGTTAVGPHRSDLLVSEVASGRPARDCSTGQQKALLISIVLAEARVRAAAGGWLPVLLLDEVAAHLDRERRGDLFAEITTLGAQAWLTGTDAATFAPLGERAQFFTVRASTLQAHDPTRFSHS